jgi:type II secretory pathway pseudopilin PulG
MRRPFIRRDPARHAQAGYVLLVMMLFLTLLAIGLAAVAPAIGQQIRRDKELETIHRGKQYARAVRLYYRKFGRYPVTLDNLDNTNNMRFLRKRFKDPMSTDGTWRIIHFGEARLTMPQSAPLLPGATVLGGSNTTGAFGSSAGPGLGFGSSGAAASQPSSGDPSQTGSASGAQPASPGGLTLGGGAIVGVAPTSKKESIKELNQQTHYNDWEFVYDPRLDIGLPGTPPGAPPGPPLQGAPGVPLPPGTAPAGTGGPPGPAPSPKMQ